MKTFGKMGSWRFVSLASVLLLIATLFLTSNAESDNTNIKPDNQTVGSLFEIDRETWKSLPSNVRFPVYETFSKEKKRTFWQLKHEELKRLDWTPAELKHIDSFYSVICENPLLMERGAESEDIEDWFEVFRYNWREYAHDVFGWNRQLLYAISMSADEVLNTRGEIKVYAPITMGVEFLPATRSMFDDCIQCPAPGYFPHPQYCDLFYVCTYNLVAYIEACPIGLVFDPSMQVCNWPDIVPCW
jgi:hypothetical protein